VTAVFAATLDSSTPVESGETVTFVNDVSIDLSNITLPPDTTVAVQDVKDEMEDELLEGLTAAGAAVSISFSESDLSFESGVGLRMPLDEGADPARTAVFHKHDGHWDYQPTTIEDGFATAVVTHFSTYAVLEAPAAEPPKSTAKLSELKPGDTLYLVSDTTGSQVLYSTTGPDYPGDFKPYEPIEVPEDGLVLYALALAPNRRPSEVVTFRVVTASTEITFADEKLEEAIREEIGKWEGPLTAGDVRDIDRLDAEQKGIASLAGMEYLANLRILNLSKNAISDISPLAGLTELRELDFNDNAVEDISPLAEMTWLHTLSFDRNQVSDITPLEGLTRLTTLTFAYNAVCDISSLEGLTELRLLSFTGNEVSDISPLTGLTELEHLLFAGNDVVDISPLAGLTQLSSLFMGSNQVSDITPLGSLTGLRDVHLSGNQIEDITPLEHLVNLEWLMLGWNKITDISPLVRNAGLGEGDELDLRNNYLDLSPESQNMRDIQALQDRGVVVTYTPQSI